MQKLSTLVPMILVAALAGCDGGSSDTSDTSDDSGPGEDVEVVGEISEDTTWSSDKILGGIVTVTNNAVLTVEPGVTVRGKTGSALVIAQGSRLEAVGSKDAPIVFTSAEAAGGRNRGDWGGIVLLGKAATNLEGGSGLAEGLEKNSEYGGGSAPDAGYSCGTLKWLRVEFAGFELTTDNELNGITFYSCGTGTVVDYVQVHMGDDDGIESFGGNWSGKHIVITGAADDSFDFDQGFSGKLQYVLIQQDPGVGNYGFEWSNQSVDFDASPRTLPTVSNATLIGTGGTNETKSGGIKLKEGAGAEIHNTIVTNFYNAQVELTEDATVTQADAGAIKLTDNLFFSNGLADKGATLYTVSEGSTYDLKGLVEDAGNNNQLEVDPKLGSIAWGKPDVVPAADSPVLGAGRPVAGLESTDFIGAVKDRASDWTTGWTTFAIN